MHATDDTPFTHRIALESGQAGRVLDCSKITMDFTRNTMVIKKGLSLVLHEGQRIGCYHGPVFSPGLVDSENYEVGLAGFANASNDKDKINAKLQSYHKDLNGLPTPCTIAPTQTTYMMMTLNLPAWL